MVMFYPPGLFKVVKLTFSVGKTSVMTNPELFFFSFHPRLSREWYGPLEGITSSSTVELKTSQYIIEHKRMFLGVKVE